MSPQGMEAGNDTDDFRLKLPPVAIILFLRLLNERGLRRLPALLHGGMRPLAKGGGLGRRNRLHRRALGQLLRHFSSTLKNPTMAMSSCACALMDSLAPAASS